MIEKVKAAIKQLDMQGNYYEVKQGYEICKTLGGGEVVTAKGKNEK